MLEWKQKIRETILCITPKHFNRIEFTVKLRAAKTYTPATLSSDRSRTGLNFFLSVFALLLRAWTAT